MSNFSTFNELWEACEKTFQEDHNRSCQDILDELHMKIELYRKIDQKITNETSEIKTAKSRLLGEILLTITNLSLKEDINVFQELLIAYRRKTD